MYYRAYLLILTGFLVGCLSCTPINKTRVPGTKPHILATTGMVADMVKHIVGDSATVEALMGPGVDPHLYKASQGDLRKMIDADYLFYNGVHLEGKLSGIFDKQQRVKPVVPVGDGLPDLIRLNAHTYDPHIWFDVQLWKAATANATRALISLDTAGTAYYQANANRYQLQLDSLDRWIRRQINTIPPQKRVLITAHDAFSYFGRRYGVEVKGLQGISTLSEFGLRDVSDLVNFIVGHGIPAVFVETSVSDKSLKAVMAGVKERGGQVRIGGNLYSDAMGKAGTPDGTYIGMVKHNVRTIVEALGGTADRTP